MPYDEVFNKVFYHNYSVIKICGARGHLQCNITYEMSTKCTLLLTNIYKGNNY